MLPDAITVRESTEAERGRDPKLKRYVVANAERSENIIHVFGLPQTGESREEVVFWADRCASKNGLTFARPDGWESVEGALPERDG